MQNITFKSILWSAMLIILASFVFASVYDTGLIAYYNLDSDGSDLTSYGTDLSNNGVTFTTGKLNNGADFESSEADYLYNNSISNIWNFTGSDAFSICSWLKFESTPSPLAVIFSTRDNTGYDWLIFRNNDAPTWVDWHADNFNPTCTITPSTARFDFYCFVWDGASNQQRIYINSTSFCNTTVASTLTFNIRKLVFGSQYFSGSYQHFYDGIIDEVSVFNKTLSISEIAELYNNGNYLPYSSHSFNIGWDGFQPTNATINTDSTLSYYYNLSGDFINANCSFYWNNTLQETQTNKQNSTTYNFDVTKSPVLQANITSWINCTADNGLTSNSSVKSVYWNITLPSASTNASGYGGSFDGWNIPFSVTTTLFDGETTKCEMFNNYTLPCESKTGASSNFNLSCDIPFTTQQSIIFWAYCNSSSYNATSTNTTISITNIESIGSNISSYSTVQKNFTVLTNHSKLKGIINCGVYSNNSVVNCIQNTSVNNQSIILCALNDSIINNNILFTPYCTNTTYSYNGSSKAVYVTNGNQINFSARSMINGSLISNFIIRSKFGNFTATGTNLTVYAIVNQSDTYYFWHPEFIGNPSNITITANVTSQTYEFNAYTINSVNFTFKDEENNSVLAGINITYELISDIYSLSNITSTGYAYHDLLQPSLYTIRYYADDYDERFYYLNLENRSTYELTLYLLNTSNIDEITATVYDNANNKVESVYIRYLRYDINTNSYMLVGQAETDSSGVAKLYLQKNTEFYKFMLYYPFGTLVKETSPSYVYSDNINFQINTLEDIAQSFENTLSVDHSLTFNNDTNNFRFTYSDSDGLMTKAKLDVYRVNAQDKILIDSTEQTAASGTILISITPENNTVYLAQASIYYNNDFEVVDTLEYYVPSSYPFGLIITFLAWILTIAFAFIALYNPAVAAVFVTLPNLFVSLMGIAPKELIPINIIIVILGFGLAYFLGGRGY